MKAYAELYVVERETLNMIGMVSEYKGVVFPQTFVGCSKFNLYVPMTEHNIELLKEKRIVYLNEEINGEITRVETIVNDSMEKVLKVSGCTLEWLLKSRIVWGTYKAENKRPDVMMSEIVVQNCINPNDSKRVIPFLGIKEINENINIEKISHQKTGDEVYDECKTLCETYGFGYSISLDIMNKKMWLNFRYGLDRSIDQSQRDFVLLSTDMQDILSSEYIKDIEDYKTTALVAGEVLEDSRLTVVSGDNNISGFERKELYVDARDIQSDESADINKLLNSRGLEKLGSQIIAQTFKFTIKPENNSYIYGKDYFLGDIITVYDSEIGVQANVIVSEVEYEWDGDKYSMNHTFGVKNLQFMDKIKRMIK